MKEIYWTPIAKASYQSIIEFTLIKWSEEVVIYFENLVDSRLQELSVNPFMAPPYFNSEFRRLVLHKNVSIFYEIASQQIIVLLVWDNRRNPLKLKEELSKYRAN